MRRKKWYEELREHRARDIETEMLWDYPCIGSFIIHNGIVISFIEESKLFFCMLANCFIKSA
jgi:hypothetical protein